MSSQRRLIAALDGFVRQRRDGVRSQKHLRSIREFVRAELQHRGIKNSNIGCEASIGLFYQRQVDLVVRLGADIAITIVLITQSGSVRRNLNNRRRDIVGDAVNLRAANPDGAVGVIYLLTADEEATRKGVAGTSPVDELAEFLSVLQRPAPPSGRPLLDAAALIAVRQDNDGRIRVEPMPVEINILGGFFDKLVATVGK